MNLLKAQLNKISLRNVIIDVCIVFSALYVSLALRLSGEDKSNHFETLQNFVGFFVVIRIATLYYYGAYKAIWRYSSLVDLTRLLRAVFVSSLFFFALSYLLPYFGRLPRSVYFIDFFIALAGLCGVRLLDRLYFERKGGVNQRRKESQRVLIYGAGENGRLLASRLKNDSYINQNPIGFIDDDKKKWQRTIMGIPVLGSGEDLDALITRYDITGVIVSVSNARGDLVRNILEKCRKFNITPQIYNNFSEKQLGPSQIYREVSLYDLLNRQCSEIDFSGLRSLVRGKTVLVTGAGGSIGSELARQLYRYEPEKLLLLDHSEYNLYAVDSELRLSANEKSKVIPLLADIKDTAALAQVFKDYNPQLIYHAAAYKHVHLVEYNPYSAILNNVMGTMNLLELAAKFKVPHFLNISTDKAVNPVGIMGSSKRVCELLVSEYGDQLGLRYSSVRFGNVLGSSGSLIPLLKKQISEGGPLTITHPEMKRYFMLIPEAVSLVLMSSLISNPADIQVLKMGEQIKIVDLAKSLLALSGKPDLEITYTGLRPGEKMYEEMYISGNELKTIHSDILTIPNGDNVNSKMRVKQAVVGLIELAKMRDQKALEVLKQLASSNPLPATNEETSLNA